MQAPSLLLLLLACSSKKLEIVHVWEPLSTPDGNEAIITNYLSFTCVRERQSILALPT